MQKELKFNGYSAQPSDYECQDGDLANVLNLIPKNGSLHPLPQPKEILTLKHSASNVVYAHKTQNYIHYIVWFSQNLNRLYYIDSDDVNTENPFFTDVNKSKFTSIIQVTSIGNTLLLLTDKGMFYFVWSSDDNTYVNLGKHIPELPISFGLQGEFVPGEEAQDYTRIDLQDKFYYNKDKYPFTIGDRDKDNVSKAVFAKINKLIAEKATKAGRFAFPFFIRYAYRLYDGSLVMHSAPIFMPCSINKPAQFAACDIDFDKDTRLAESLRIWSYGAVYELDYNVISSSLLSLLKSWSDIVKSVDIFISAPIYKYNMSGENAETILKFHDELKTTNCICKRLNSTFLYDVPQRYQEHNLRQLAKWQENSIDLLTMPGFACIELPQFSDEEYHDKIKKCSTFYLLKSIPIDELSTSITKIDISENYLESLVTREAMNDDYDSHTALLPKFAFNYNSRLSLCDLSKQLFPGYNSATIFCRTDGYIYLDDSDNIITSEDVCETLKIYVYIKKNGVTKILKTSDSGTHALNAPLLYYYYPDTDAYKAVFEFTDNNSNITYYSVSLEKHDFLNGSFFWANGKSIKEAGMLLTEAPVVTVNNIIDIGNKIYTSEINNPYSFPVTCINTIGSGRIIGLATATKAISEGQFGQFPLYAFSTDGIWALEVSQTTGAFSSKQPFSRDICINAKSITQIDDAVLFASNRGIMLISRSNVICISDVLDNGKNLFDFKVYPHYDKILEMMGTNYDFPLMLSIQEHDFIEDFLTDCQIIYAYIRQAIIVFNPKYQYAYYYSLMTKQWTKITSTIRSKIASYPEAYCQAMGNKLFDYSFDDDVSNENQFLITRPIKLDASLKDVNKTIDTIITRGNFEKGHVATVLYGSRDLKKWFPVYTSKDHYLRHFSGTPYKYFRILLICSLTHDESIWGSTIQFTTRLTNKQR